MDNIEQAIKPLEDKLQAANAEVKRIKTAINCYCEAMGQPARYPDIGEESRQGAAPRADEYYGRPLATVAAEALEKRKVSGLGAATLDQIFTELSIGGFKFEGKSDGIQKRGLAIAMGKNTAKFHKLPNETWGLKDWYKDVKPSKNKGLKIMPDIVEKVINDDEESKK